MSAPLIPNIKATEKELRKDRIKAVQGLLFPLREKRPVACSIYEGPTNGNIVIGAHEGKTGASHYRDWRFTSKIAMLRCNYFEVWKPSGKNIFFLELAYLNIYLLNRESYAHEELICLHCDPYLYGTTTPSKCKCGPHIHIKRALPPIPKSHLPLNFDRIDVVLSSLIELDAAIKNGIEIICHEVLRRFLPTAQSDALTEKST